MLIPPTALDAGVRAHVHPAIAAPIGPLLRTTWVQICLVLAIIIILWGSVGVHLVHLHADKTRDVIRDGSHLAHAAEQGIGGMIARVDQVLRFARQARAADPVGFDLDHWIDAARIDWRGLQLVIIDRHGMLQTSRRNSSRTRSDLSDRPYFRFNHNDRADTLSISEPLILRSTGKWVVLFSRKLLAADGSFDGVLVLPLNASRLTRLYGTLDIGRGSLMVTGMDGIVRARASTSGAEGTGRDIRSPGFRLISSALAATQGSFQSISPLDGVDRVVSFRRLDAYPLVVSVGLDTSEVFTTYYQERTKYLVAGVVVMTLVLLGGVLLIIQNWRLMRSRQVLSAAVENISQGLLMVDQNRKLLLINRRAIELLSIPPELLARSPTFDDLIEWQRGTHEFGPGSDVESVVLTRDKAGRVDFRNTCYERTRPDGRELEVRTKLLPAGGAMRTFTDITERKHAEAHALHLAHHDTLTGLPNRTLLRDRLSRAISLAVRNHGTLAVLALDLDRFKSVNDRFGHPAGDRLLISVTERLKSALREPDTLARVGGDELIVLQTDVGQPMAAGQLAQRLIDVLMEPFEVNGQLLRIGVSVGVALHPADGNSAEALLKSADTALYRAKSRQGGGLCFFEAQMDLQLYERWALEQDLRLAIGTPQLRLHYQPIFATATRSITGFEALLRWQHPVRGDIPPATFIPLAEETGLILAIGAWVLEEACSTAAGWAEPKRLAVNLSSAQLRGGNLPVQVAGILLRTGLPAGMLELEVTETMLISDPNQALAVLHELRAMSVRIACDDFGTGYSSFNYLQNLAFDRIKIDRSFVRGLGTAPSALRIVQAILAMAQSLGMEVTAEGVETHRQLAILQQQGCAEIQGYLLGRPIPSAEISRCLSEALAIGTDRDDLLVPGPAERATR
ncbi:MAG: EAL domain-containing protein [Acetobacteraceae bacterium]